ncbi:hypothetical protein TCSYLVIO_009807 [Trypanosoma cruzi]|nr:hypothetical protein TCSYLVIO_009807 [Trypanosoma cruzi]
MTDEITMKFSPPRKKKRKKKKHFFPALWSICTDACVLRLVYGYVMYIPVLLFGVFFVVVVFLPSPSICCVGARHVYAVRASERVRVRVRDTLYLCLLFDPPIFRLFCVCVRVLFCFFVPVTAPRFTLAPLAGVVANHHHRPSRGRRNPRHDVARGRVGGEERGGNFLCVSQWLLFVHVPCRVRSACFWFWFSFVFFMRSVRFTPFVSHTLCLSLSLCVCVCVSSHLSLRILRVRSEWEGPEGLGSFF